jgi:hypothetical protein
VFVWLVIQKRLQHFFIAQILSQIMTPKNYTTTTTRRTLDVVIRVVEIQIATQSLRASVQQQGHVAKTCFPIILSLDPFWV